MDIFIVLTTQRSGSTLFMRTLNGHPNIEVARGEIFSKKNKEIYSYKNYVKKMLKIRFLFYMGRKNLVCKYIDGLLSKKRNGDLYGFKLMYNQLFGELENWIHNNQVYIIHLIRENTMKTIVSRISAKKRKLYHVKNNSVVKNIKIKIDPKRLIKNIEKVENEIIYYRKKFNYKRYIEVTYEGITNEKENTYRKVFEFLGVEILKELPCPPLKKINPDSLEEILINFDEIYYTLKNTEHEQYLK